MTERVNVVGAIMLSDPDKAIACLGLAALIFENLPMDDLADIMKVCPDHKAMLRRNQEEIARQLRAVHLFLLQFDAVIGLARAQAEADGETKQ